MLRSWSWEHKYSRGSLTDWRFESHPIKSTIFGSPLRMNLELLYALIPIIPFKFIDKSIMLVQQQSYQFIKSALGRATNYMKSIRKTKTQQYKSVVIVEFISNLNVWTQIKSYQPLKRGVETRKCVHTPLNLLNYFEVWSSAVKRRIMMCFFSSLLRSPFWMCITLQNLDVKRLRSITPHLSHIQSVIEEQPKHCSANVVTIAEETPLQFSRYFHLKEINASPHADSLQSILT